MRVRTLPSYTPNQNEFIVVIFVAAVAYLLVGPFALVATGAAFIGKKWIDRQHNIQSLQHINDLAERAVNKGDIDALNELEEQQVGLSYEQTLEMLLNSYHLGSHAAIDYLARRGFKVNFYTVSNIFMKGYDLALLKMLIEKFIDKDSVPQASSLNSMLRYLCANNNYALIESLYVLYTESVASAIFSLIEKNVDVNSLLQFLDKKGGFEFFENIKRLIDCPAGDEFLSDKLLSYLAKSKTSGNFLAEIEIIICRLFSKSKYALVEQILTNYPEFLSTQRKVANKLLSRYCRDPIALDLLLRHGADVHSTYDNGTTLVESVVSSTYMPSQERKKLFDIFLKHRADLHRAVRDTPKQAAGMTLLGLLPFVNLTVDDRVDFQAMRLQKFLAMFLEIPGTSLSNRELCKHGYMQDAHAYLNFILDLYFRQGTPENLEEFHRCLRQLRSEEGDYDADSLFETYQQGRPIVLPVHIKDDFGGGRHIATLGLLKTGPNSHIRIEADRGFGRHDFSIYSDSCFNYLTFRRYAKSLYSLVSVSEWHEHPSLPVLSFDIQKQEDDFCTSISAKYAFNIAYFLCFTRQTILSAGNQFVGKAQPELISHCHEAAQEWFMRISVDMVERMLVSYKSLEPKFIDPTFLAVAESKHEKNKSLIPQRKDLGESLGACQ